jgi:hypothetical protein
MKGDTWMLLLKSGSNLADLMGTPYKSTPYCSCSFQGNASCNFSSGCSFTGGGQCSFSTSGSACGS